MINTIRVKLLRVAKVLSKHIFGLKIRWKYLCTWKEFRPIKLISYVLK